MAMPSTRRQRYFEYRLRKDAWGILRDLDRRLGRLEQGEWVVNCKEIARQANVSHALITELKRGNAPLTELAMAALVGVAVLNGMDADEAYCRLFEHVDVRPARVRRGLRAVA